ncbi:MAG: YihY/virulence factor BrkB family protein [Pseudomonadota bacterium]
MPIRSLSDFWDFLRDLKDEIDRDRVLAVAAGVTFYAILAVVPAITALISVFGLVLSPAEVPGLLAPITSMMPEEAATLITAQAERISGTANDTLSLTVLISLLIALWSANGGTKALIEALGIAYDVKETRGFVRLNLVSLAFTLAGIGIVIVLGVLVAALPFLVDQLGPVGEDLILALRWPGAGGNLLLGPRLARTRVGLDHSGCGCRRRRADRGFGGAGVVCQQLRQLRRDLWLACCGGGADAVDLAFDRDGADRRGNQRRAGPAQRAAGRFGAGGLGLRPGFPCLVRALGL